MAKEYPLAACHWKQIPLWSNSIHCRCSDIRPLHSFHLIALIAFTGAQLSSCYSEKLIIDRYSDTELLTECCCYDRRPAYADKVLTCEQCLFTSQRTVSPTNDVNILLIFFANYILMGNIITACIMFPGNLFPSEGSAFIPVIRTTRREEVKVGCSCYKWIL